MARTPFLSGRPLLVAKILLFVAAGLWIYAPAFHGAWLRDDDLYLPNNPLRHDPARLWKIWFAPGNFIEYYPIGETLQALQWWLWGNDTLGYHLTNVMLHIGNALLVWRLLDKFKLKLAWLGGLLFLVHPVMVESVAWIAEFKNALSLMPFLVALAAWHDFEERGERRDYLIALGGFLLAMLCKISMAPFPVVILLYAWWKRGRIGGRDFVNAAPFFVISVALGTLTILAGDWFLRLHHTSADAVAMGGPVWRLVLAGISASYYLSTFFFPFNMDPMPELWRIDPASPRQWVPLIVLLAGAGWFWSKRGSWGRHALLGMGFFFLMVAPFLGFNAASYMNASWIYDHFLYLPCLGLVGLITAAASDLEGRIPVARRTLALGAVAAVLGICALVSHAYSEIFAQPVDYFRYVIGLHPGNWTNYNALGNALRKEGRLPEAFDQFEKASAMVPGEVMPLNNLGEISVQMGKSEKAVGYFQRVLAMDPDYAEARTGMGNAMLYLKNYPEAVKQYEAALRLTPEAVGVQNGLANALMMEGKLPEAAEHAREAVRLSPNYVEAQCTLGAIYAQQGKLDEAIAQFEKAAVLDPADERISEMLRSLRTQRK